MAENSAVIIDLGSYQIKAGYAYSFPSEEEPRLVTPTVVTYIPTSPGSTSQAVSPIRSGAVVDWDALESLLHYCLYEQLGWVQGAEGPLVIVEPALTSRDDRERLTQLAFEVFNVAAYYAVDSAVASVYGVAKLSGVVLDIGYEKIDAVPVLEGQLQPSAAVRLPYGGRHLTSHLKDLLARRGVICSEEEAEKIKVACLRVAPSAADAAAGTPELPGKEDGPPPRPTSYTLADGSTIDVAKEVLELGEALLDPSRLGLDLPPLAQTVQTAGMVTTVHGEKEARRALAENLLVCGGGAAIPGLAERLLSEVTSLAHPSLTPALCPIPDYMPSHTAQRAGWMGGALLAKVVFSTTSAHQVQHPVLKVDYEESGPSVVHRKCC